MAKIPSVNLDAVRCSAIANSILAECRPITEAHGNTQAAKDAAKLVGEEEVGSREGIMLKVATLSIQGNWTHDEVKVATKNAAALLATDNDKSSAKTIATMISEVRRAALPLARGHLADLIKLRDAAWANEQEMKRLDPKDAATPIAKAYKRKYHFLLTGLLGAAEKGIILTTVDECVAYAEANDPDQDAAKVFAKFEKIRADLAKFYTEFPVDDIGASMTTLNTVTLETMRAAQAKRNADTDAEVAHISPPTPTVVIPTVVNTPDIAKLSAAFSPVVAPVVSDTTVAEGAVDMFDDLLGDNLELKAA